jgi:KipI family sensor histidine kinase inhibitor
MSGPRIVAAGDAMLVAEFDDRLDARINLRVLSLAAAVRAARISGVRDVVPTFRSVAVHFDPLLTDVVALFAILQGGEAVHEEASAASARVVELPVCYGGSYGPDLAELAAARNLTESEVAAIHAATEYRVFMLGFVPGFAYLGTVDPRIALPRRAVPRPHVAEGSVGVAGAQTGVYPVQTPGGWNIIGRTPVKMFDPDRAEPSLLKPGDVVRFRAIPAAEFESPVAAPPGSLPVVVAPPGSLPVVGSTTGSLPVVVADLQVRRDAAFLDIVAPGLLTTVQDLGRWGHQAEAIPVAGPMDPLAHRLANALVGNPRDAATLEVTLAGPTVRFSDSRTFAVAGAEFDLLLDERPVAPGATATAPAGATLRFGDRRSGARAYLAIGGGVDTPIVLGSRATHVPTATGGWHGRPLRRGDRLALGIATRGTETPRPHGGAATLAAERATLVVRVLAGPQDDRFAGDAMELLTSAPYEVTVDSNRMGFRLQGPSLRHLHGADILSDATPLGALQVPASGQPVLLMADRQTTGGYAKLATVISADIGIAAQAAPGDRLLFRRSTREEAIAALVALERAILAVESRTM